MSLRLEREKDEVRMEIKYWIADRRLYLDRTRDKVVEHGDTAAAFLYCTPGTRVPWDFAVEKGLVEEEKAAPKAANKARKRTANKKE